MPVTFMSSSLGCRINQAEKEALDRQLTGLGFQPAKADPDVWILNTCAVTGKAEREARQAVYQARRKLPKAAIVVTGCAATSWLKEGISLPDTDLVVPNTDKEYLARMIAERVKNGPRTASGGPLATDKYLGSGRAILKIQDGCQRFCSYCIVPYLRGLPKSYSVASLVAAAHRLEPHISELILTAINTEAYGYDTKETFSGLLQALLERTGIRRLSLGSIHPWSLDRAFFRFYRKNASSRRLVNFFHVPLQSGSNKMLALMKRGYMREEIMAKLDLLVKMQPFTFIGTDIITGFLEETDRDFEDTYNFLKQAPIARFHVFRFSPRPHTAAYFLAKRLHQPTPAVKQTRAQAIIQLGQQKYEAFLKTHVDHTFEALMLEKREGNYQHALLSNQVPVLIQAAGNLQGEIKNIKIQEYKKGSLFGKMVS